MARRSENNRDYHESEDDYPAGRDDAPNGSDLSLNRQVTELARTVQLGFDNIQAGQQRLEHRLRAVARRQETNSADDILAKLEGEDQRFQSLDQAWRTINRESIAKQVQHIVAIDRSARNLLLENLDIPEREIRGFPITFTVGLIRPRNGWRGQWQFRSHGNGSSENLARVNLGNQGYWDEDSAHPTAEQVHELRNRFRLSRRLDVTEHIDLVWVPTQRIQGEDDYTDDEETIDDQELPIEPRKILGHNSTSDFDPDQIDAYDDQWDEPNAARRHDSPEVSSEHNAEVNDDSPDADEHESTGVSENSRDAEQRKESEPRQGNDCRRGTGTWDVVYGEAWGMGVDKPINENADNVIGDPNEQMVTRTAARKASQQSGGVVAPPQSQYTAASQGSVPPDSRPRPSKSVPRKKPTHGPDTRSSSHPQRVTRSRMQQISVGQGYPNNQVTVETTPPKRKRGRDEIADDAEESGDGRRRGADIERPKRKSTAADTKRQKYGSVRTKEAAKDLNEDDYDGEEIPVSRPAEQEDRELKDTEDYGVEMQADNEASQHDINDNEDESEASKKKTQRKKH